MAEVGKEDFERARKAISYWKKKRKTYVTVVPDDFEVDAAITALDQAIAACDVDVDPRMVKFRAWLNAGHGPDLDGTETEIVRIYNDYLNTLGLLRTPATGGWQDISTAPRDGTLIIGAAFGRHNNFIQRLWWQPEFEAWISSCREMTMAPGYLINGKSSELHSPEIYKPTHWMPYQKPAAPQSSDGGRDAG